MDHEHSESPLEDAVLRRRDALARLAELARRQADFVATDETGALLEILAEREALVREAVALTEQLDGGALERLLDTLTPPQRRRLASAAEESDRLIETIARRDAEDLATLGARRDALAGQLTGNARAKAAVGAYGPGDRVSPRVQDREI